MRGGIVVFTLRCACVWGVWIWGADESRVPVRLVLIRCKAETGQSGLGSAFGSCEFEGASLGLYLD